MIQFISRSPCLLVTSKLEGEELLYLLFEVWLSSAQLSSSHRSITSSEKIVHNPIFHLPWLLSSSLISTTSPIAMVKDYPECLSLCCLHTCSDLKYLSVHHFHRAYLHLLRYFACFCKSEVSNYGAPTLAVSWVVQRAVNLEWALVLEGGPLHSSASAQSFKMATPEGHSAQVDLPPDLVLILQFLVSQNGLCFLLCLQIWLPPLCHLLWRNPHGYWMNRTYWQT